MMEAKFRASSNTSNLPTATSLRIDEHSIQSKILYVTFILESFRICMFRLSAYHRRQPYLCYREEWNSCLITWFQNMGLKKTQQLILQA